MRTDRVGIYAPYDWDEATYAAIRLATLARQLGQVPSYRSYGAGITKGRCFHDDWDGEVICSRKGVRDWIKEQRVIIWFGLHKSLLNYSKSYGVKNVLVPLVHRLEHRAIRDLRLFDDIYCSNLLTRDILENAGLRNTVHTDWDSGFPFREKTAHYVDGRERVLVLPEWPITNEWGLTLAYTVRTLLDAEPSVDVTILQLRHWPKMVNRAMLDLMSCHASRVDMLRRPTWHELLHAYQVHDWALYLPEKINIGVRLAEVYSQGLPVVTLDLPPTKEFVKHGQSAYLIACEQHKDLLGRPMARINTHDVMEAVHQTIRDRESWYKLTVSRQEPWAQRVKYFETTWSSMLSPF